MKSLLKSLLIIPILVLLVVLCYGLVNFLELMKTFDNEAWVLPIFVLGMLAIVPRVIFMAAQTEADDPEQEEDQENEDHPL